MFIFKTSRKNFKKRYFYPFKIFESSDSTLISKILVFQKLWYRVLTLNFWLGTQFLKIYDILSTYNTL